MEKYTGKSIFKGIAIGKILFYQKGEQPVKRVKIEDTAEQIKRYEDARAKAAEQLEFCQKSNIAIEAYSPIAHGEH